MRDFPSCFGESGVQIVDSSGGASRNNQNTVTSVYQSRLRGGSCLVSVTWSKSLIGHGLTVGIDDSVNKPICRVDVKPSLFSKKKGSNSVELDASKVEIHWDLSSAKFGSGPEPVDGFHLAVVLDHQMLLLLGDSSREAYKKGSIPLPPSNVAFVARKENIFGKKAYQTKAQFCDDGHLHDILINCETAGPKDLCLCIRVDKKMVMQVKRLIWNFRGNQTIVVDGVHVEVYWDVHDWLFSSPPGSAVFMFQASASLEKSWSGQIRDPSLLSWSSSQVLRDSYSQRRGFSLVLYAWKHE